ncbi:hypothetical protein [Candidatus Enterococcus clewellii]|uniref:hypothetical protein n=1 Tax=Candidatus Enterococcus clewellii TaxID=1834193 RepID=UPI0020166F52|nr:hypothetical protein [Enterococcus sp. 9E7_DIV0242]
MEYVKDLSFDETVKLYEAIGNALSRKTDNITLDSNIFSSDEDSFGYRVEEVHEEKKDQA